MAEAPAIYGLSSTYSLTYLQRLSPGHRGMFAELPLGRLGGVNTPVSGNPLADALEGDVLRRALGFLPVYLNRLRKWRGCRAIGRFICISDINPGDIHIRRRASYPAHRI